MSADPVIRARGERALYLQLADQIARSIEDGRLRAGDRVPSEPQLMRQHGVSRSTAIKALEHLAQGGLVRREQGRGTFVDATPLVKRRPQLRAFSDQVRAGGHEPTHELLSVGPPPKTRDANGLRAWFGTDTAVLRLVRLRSVDGEPIGLHTTLLDADVAERAGISAKSMRPADASLYAQLDAAGVQIVRADEHLQAVSASRSEARRLDVRTGAPLMRVVRVSYGHGGAALEVTDARYVGERFDYGVSLVHPGRGRSTRQGQSRGEDHDGHEAPDGDRTGGGVRSGGARLRQVRRRGLE